MHTLFRTMSLIAILMAISQEASADVTVTLNTSALVDHPAGPFSFYVALTDGSGVGDGNNSVTLTNISFGGGSALGSTLAFGGATGSLETKVTITDTSFFGFFTEQFAPGLQLSFSLHSTMNDEAGAIPDRFTFFILDSSGVPVPTLAPYADYFLGVDVHSTGLVFDAWGSDASRSPSVGSPVSIPAPTLIAQLPNTQISTTASGLVYSRVSQTFNGTVTINNVSTSTFTGPFQIFFTSLTAGVVLNNPTGAYNSTSYVTVPAVTMLGPGQSAAVNVQFENPSNATITFTPAVYSGSLN